jgi:hypothetical protein
MKANWRSSNSPNVVWINTEMHRCTQMDEDVSYPIDELGQRRNCKTPVPRYSMFAGTPSQEDVDATTRAIFWRSYAAVVALTVMCVVILANWPN